MRVKCVILGGGGHASVVLESLLLEGKAQAIGVLDRDTRRHGKNLLGVPVLGGDEQLSLLRQRGVTHFVVGLGSVGDARGRVRLYDSALEAGLTPLTVMHPSAIVSAHAILGGGCQLLPGCLVNAGARLEENVIVNSGAVVEHDCILEAHSHVASGASIASGVRVGRMAHVGIGATVLQGVRLGARAVLGAGAVALHDIPEDCRAVGVPARPLFTRS